MVAVTAEQLPVHPRGYSYEPKWDGYRAIAHRTGARVALQSRQLRPLTPYFPETVAAVAALDVDAVLDGEIVLWKQGRLDFAALQQRIHPSNARVRELATAQPATYVAFDLLALAGTDLRAQPYAARRALLEDLLGRQLPHGLVLTPASTDPAVARTWLIGHTAAGIEGVVAKRLDHPYREGGRSWRKVRALQTVEAVVGGVLGSLPQPEALILGRQDHRGRLRVVGHTSALPKAAQAELGKLLLPADPPDHPWPPTLPSSRFGQRPSAPIVYQQVAPSTVVELTVDTAFEAQRWRHPARFVRVRTDLQPADVTRLPEPD